MIDRNFERVEFYLHHIFKLYRVGSVLRNIFPSVVRCHEEYTRACKMSEQKNPKVKEREFICECIQLFRELPSLWNVKSKEYHDRDKKNIAYESLLSKYKEMFPQASKDDVKKKFNSLRTNYRKELKKHLLQIQM